MLVSLHVKNFAIIEEEEVYFGDNLNILTGETGAGKSIIIGSINACLGGKVSKDLVRKGADCAYVELVFHTEDGKVLDKLKSLEIECEDGDVILSRRILANGRTTARLNGAAVTAAVLKEVTALLIDIHGQHEHQSLLNKAKHLELLDRFAKDAIGDQKERVKALYEEYAAIKKELASCAMNEEERLRELSYLEYAISEIEAAKLVPGEDEELYRRHKILANAAQLAQGMADISRLTSGDSGASDQIGRAVRLMTRLVEYDPNLSDAFSQLCDMEGLMNDFNREISDYISDISDCGQELTEVEERLDQITRLKSKYGPETKDVFAWLEKSKKKRERLADYDSYLADLRQRAQVCENRLASGCRELSGIRRKKAAELSQAMREALIDLNFLDVRFDMEFEPAADYTPNGIDDAQFYISTNPGEELRPLSKVASGGELSRIMLAIKSVLADRDDIETLIFDEIDVGVSGRTAQKVSEKLAVIARSHQVICITHLPQIAAMSDTHFIIEKESDKAGTRTTIRKLDEEGSVKELARILGGARITDTVLDSAREMRQLAVHSKNC